MSPVRIVLAFFPTILPVVAQSSWIARYAPFGLSGSAQALAADASGNIFVAGTVYATEGAETCAFKMDSLGNALGNFCFPGSGAVQAAVDPQGNLVLGGTTDSPQSLPLVLPLISQTTSEAGFVMKLDSQLTKILFSTLLGASQSAAMPGGTVTTALALDSAGNIYVGGSTLDGNYPVTPGAYQTIRPMGAGDGDSTSIFIPIYLTAISSSGDRILYSTYFSGNVCNYYPSCNLVPQFPEVTQIAVDSTGAVVMAGYSTGQLPVTPGVLSPSCACPYDEQVPFLAKFSPGGSQLLWATYINNTNIAALALDSSGNVVIGGQAYTGFSATSGALQTVNPGAPDMRPGYADYDSGAGFVAKIDSSGQRYIFATYLGGNNFQEFISTNGLLAGTNGVTGLSVDSQGTIWVTGGSLPSELPLPGSIPLVGSTYLIGLTSDGSAVKRAVTVPEGAAGQSLAISPLGPVALGKSGTVLVPVSGQGPSLTGIVNSAGRSATGSVAPNELVSFYGAGVGPETAISGQVVNGVLTSSLGGVQVLFDGVAAPLLYAGPNQINAVVPSAVAGKSSTAVEIVTPAGTITGVTPSVVAAAPEVFVSGPPGIAAVAWNQDGTPNSTANPAPVGSIVSIWGTGGGASNNPNADGSITGSTIYPLQLPVSVGTEEAPAVVVQYSGDAPGMVKGVIQVNFQIPPPPGGFPPGALEVPFYLQVGGTVSDPFTIYVE